MNRFNIMEIASWTILAALAVLIVMNASQFATAVSSISGAWGNQVAMFTGSGYNQAGYAQQAKKN